MQFDDILVQIGVFGKYQKTVCLLLSLVAIPMAWHAIGQVFLAANTDYWCALPPDQSLNCTELGAESTACFELQKEQSIPFTVDEDGELEYSKCERYVTALTWDLKGNGSNGTFERDEANQTTTCDVGWEYDRTQYKTTIIQDFDLVCSRQDLPGLAQSVFFAGFLTGSFVWGAVADWAGRRFTFLTSLFVASVTSTVLTFAPNFAAYSALRFFIAASNFGVYLMGFVLVSELVGPAYRTMVGTILSISFAIGYALLAMLAYLIREWRYLQLAISLPWFLFFSFLLFLPESPRWLISKKKFKQAEKVIGKMAKVNGTTTPENMLDEYDLHEKHEVVLTRQPTQLDLFRTPCMRKKTLNLFYHWFVISLVYYGLSLSTSALGVDDYVAAFVSGAVEVPAYLFSWFSIQKWGRRLPLSLSLLTGGLACLTTIFIARGAIRASVAMVGKFAISESFNIIYIYSSELFPTPVRSMGVGMSSMSARLSGVIAPAIIILGKYWEPIPLIVFGGCSLIASVLSLLLPETLNHNLPETIQEGEEFGKNQGLGIKSLFIKRPSPNSDTAGTNKPRDYKKIPTTDNDTDDTHPSNV